MEDDDDAMRSMKFTKRTEWHRPRILDFAESAMRVFMCQPCRAAESDGYELLQHNEPLLFQHVFPEGMESWPYAKKVAYVMEHFMGSKYANVNRKKLQTQALLLEDLVEFRVSVRDLAHASISFGELRTFHVVRGLSDLRQLRYTLYFRSKDARILKHFPFDAIIKDLDLSYHKMHEDMGLTVLDLLQIRGIDKYTLQRMKFRVTDIVSEVGNIPSQTRFYFKTITTHFSIQLAEWSGLFGLTDEIIRRYDL